MYSINKTEYGFYLEFIKKVDLYEMKKWLEESKIFLADSPPEFTVFVDMRTLLPLTNEARVFMEEGQRLYRKSGMKRSVVILSNSLTKIQFQRIAKDTGIYEYERYIDASTEKNWKEIGLNWLLEEIDPENI